MLQLELVPSNNGLVYIYRSLRSQSNLHNGYGFYQYNFCAALKNSDSTAVKFSDLYKLNLAIFKEGHTKSDYLNFQFK